MPVALSSVAMSTPVIAAVDLGPLTGRVLFHAAAFARLLQAPLRVLSVNADRTEEHRRRVLDACLQLGPYQTDFDESQIVLRAGQVSDAIAREAMATHASLVVIGSRGHGRLSKLLLGSTSERVLRQATTPVLLVPPNEMDICSLDDCVNLTSGPLIAAVDLSENSAEQLRLASTLAQIGRQPLLLLTVARSRVTDHDASQQLRERAHALTPVTPKALIVRRGSVAEEISRCAVIEGAGLVVMGLRASPRCQPGTIASAVLKTRRAFVLAVPNRTAKLPVRHGIARAIASIAATLMLIVGSQPAAAQPHWGDADAVVAFQRAADSYAFRHRQAERQIGLTHRRAGDTGAAINTQELAAAIRAQATLAGGELFSPAVAAEFRALAAEAVRRGCDAGDLRAGVWELVHVANGPATGTRPVPACIALALPQLPEELEYRSGGSVLLVVDPHANLVVDTLPALLAGSSLR